MTMLRFLLASALVASAVPALAAEDEPPPVARDKVAMLVVFGDDPCRMRLSCNATPPAKPQFSSAQIHPSWRAMTSKTYAKVNAFGPTRLTFFVPGRYFFHKGAHSKARQTSLGIGCATVGSCTDLTEHQPGGPMRGEP